MVTPQTWAERHGWPEGSIRDEWNDPATPTPGATDAGSREARYAVIDTVLDFAVNVIDGVDPGPWVRTRRVLGEARSELLHPELRARIFDALGAAAPSTPTTEGLDVERLAALIHDERSRGSYHAGGPNYVDDFCRETAREWVARLGERP